MNELQKLNFVSYKMILLNSGQWYENYDTKQIELTDTLAGFYSSLLSWGPILPRWLVSDVLSSLSVWFWMNCSLSVLIFIACAALLVDATPGSLATSSVSALWRSRNFLIHSADVVLGLFGSLGLCCFRSIPFPLLLAHLSLVFGLHCSICDFLSIFYVLLLITFELQTFVYLCWSHFTKLSKFYTYV
jgi:hypothetical protein